MPRLPPVPISPQMRWRARFWPGVIESVATFFQSHSSSSATSCARPVSVPCPISDRAIRMTHVSSGLTTTHALISVPSLVPFFAWAASTPSGSRIPTAKPPAAAVPTMKSRREKRRSPVRDVFMSRPLPPGRLVHGRSDALVRPAPTDVGDRLVDVLVGRLWILLEQRGRGHDLTRLAVATLGHVERGPGFLNRMRGRRGQAFDGDDPVRRRQAADGNGARTRYITVDVHGTGAALCNTAAVFRTGQRELLANDPQERGIGLHVHITDLPIHVELCHGWSSRAFGSAGSSDLLAWYNAPESIVKREVRE